MALLQGFEEVNLSAPTGKVVMTVTDSVIRFNKATAAALGFPAFVRVLINDRSRQIAIQPVDAGVPNAVRFSKPEGKQIASVSVKDAAVRTAIGRYFTLEHVPEGEVAYQSVKGAVYADDNVVIFNIDDAVAGVMKKRGRKKSQEEKLA